MMYQWTLVSAFLANDTRTPSGERPSERRSAMSYVPALIQSIGAILAIVGAAYLATRGYRAQKNADREAELEKQKAESYVRFLNSYWDMNRWDVAQRTNSPKYDQDEHHEAQQEYLRAFNDMFLTASKDVLSKTYEFHTQPTTTSGQRNADILARKKAYAEVLLEMRKDAFLPTDLDADQF